MDAATVRILRSRVAELHSSYAQDLRMLERDRREAWADLKDLTSMGIPEEAPQATKLEERLDQLSERIHDVVRTLARLDEYEESLQHVDELKALDVPDLDTYLQA